MSLGKDEMLAAIWPGRVVEENNLTQSISTLRKVLGGEADGHQYIVTEPGRGYRFVARVQAEFEMASGADAQSSAAVSVPDDLPTSVPVTQRKARPVIVAVLGLAVALLLADKFVLHKDTIAPVAAPGSNRSIAVLPFENLSEDKANAYFASGIEDEILTRLSKIGALKVISRTSTQQYGSKPGNLPEIARQLGVAHILEGSVQKAGDSVRVNVQLIQADGESHLWAETYDRKLDNIFDVESEVASAIANSLQAKLTGSEQRALAITPTDNPAAYDAYLRGLVLEDGGGSLDYFRRAAAAFADAVRLDPNFALAWAHLASNRSTLYFHSTDIAENTADAVKQAADTAMRLQPELGEIWMAQGDYRYHVLRDFPGALQAYDEASKRLPNNARVLEAIAFVLSRSRGRWDEALSTMQQAMQLDPRNMDILITLARDFLSPMRRFAEARAVIDRALLVTPDNVQLVATTAQTYLSEGRLDEAAELLDPLPLALKPDAVFTAKATLLWYQGRFGTLIAVLPKTGEPLTSGQADLAVNVGYAQLQARRRRDGALLVRARHPAAQADTTFGHAHRQHGPADYIGFGLRGYRRRAGSIGNGAQSGRVVSRRRADENGRRDHARAYPGVVRRYGCSDQCVAAFAAGAERTQSDRSAGGSTLGPAAQRSPFSTPACRQRKIRGDKTVSGFFAELKRHSKRGQIPL